MTVTYRNTDMGYSSYYLTTIIYNPMKEKGLSRSKEPNPHLTLTLLPYYKVVVTTKKESYYINASDYQCDIQICLCSK